jgi:hypothetical protein
MFQLRKISHTRDDREATTEIRETNVRDVHSVDDDPALGRFHEPEE